MIRLPPAIVLPALVLGDASQEQDAPTISTYIVHDLVTQRLDLDAEQLDDTARITPEEASQRKCERLCRLISTFVEPPLDRSRNEIVEPVLTHPQKKQILTIARAAQRAWIAAFLDRCRKQVDVPVLIEGRWLVAPDAIFRELQVTSKPRVLSSAAEVDQLLARLPREAGTGSVEIPALTVRPLDHTYFSNVRDIPYVAFYRQYSGVEPLKKDLTVPDIHFAHDGLKLHADVAPLADRLIGLALSIEVLDVEQPIPARQTPLGPVADPDVRTTTITASVAVPDGGALVVTVPSSSWVSAHSTTSEQSGKLQAILLRAHIATEAELEQRDARVKDFPLK